MHDGVLMIIALVGIRDPAAVHRWRNRGLRAVLAPVQADAFQPADQPGSVSQPSCQPSGRQSVGKQQTAAGSDAARRSASMPSRLEPAASLAHGSAGTVGNGAASQVAGGGQAASQDAASLAWLPDSCWAWLAGSTASSAAPASDVQAAVLQVGDAELSGAALLEPGLPLVHTPGAAVSSSNGRGAPRSSQLAGASQGSRVVAYSSAQQLQALAK